MVSHKHDFGDLQRLWILGKKTPRQITFFFSNKSLPYKPMLSVAIKRLNYWTFLNDTLSTQMLRVSKLEWPVWC